MKIYNNTASFQKIKHSIVTSGTFDGVHLGHQQILQRLRICADKEDGEVVLLTYWPHPRLVLNPNDQIKLINTFEEKAALLEKHGVDHLVKIPFTKEFSQLSSNEFIEKVLINEIGTDKLIIGYNHRFGKNREGSFEYLKENQEQFPFIIEEIPKEEIDDIAISSTNIRHALTTGNIIHANQFMGHPFELTGKVIHGDKIGSSIGFPTANIFVNSPNKMIPADGVYAVKVSHEQKTLEGMLYIGTRPTINGKSRNIEVNIFDFNESIYASDLKITFISQVRGDMKFNNMEELAQQLHRDKVSSLHILKNHE